MRQAHDLGLLNTHIPEAYGGPALGIFEGALISEELAWGCSAISTAAEANGLAIAPLIVSASHETKLKYLEPMTRPLEGDQKPIIAAYWSVDRSRAREVGQRRAKNEADRRLHSSRLDVV